VIDPYLTALDGADPTPVLIAAVRAHALANYDKGEWSLIAEVYTDQEIGILVMGAASGKQAIGMVRRYLCPVMSVDVVYQRSA